MTDRYHSLTVVLEKDIREDDATLLLSAINLMKGVVSVMPLVANPETHMAEHRARHELRGKIVDILLGDC